MRLIPGLEEVVKMIEESASCELFSLLKRSDEAEVTDRAYANPVFVEDLARQVAKRLDDSPRVRYYSVGVKNLESIHNHNAWAFVSTFENGS